MNKCVHQYILSNNMAGITNSRSQESRLRNTDIKESESKTAMLGF